MKIQPKSLLSTNFKHNDEYKVKNNAIVNTSHLVAPKSYAGRIGVDSEPEKYFVKNT